jgi:hypothetical protein
MEPGWYVDMNVDWRAENCSPLDHCRDAQSPASIGKKLPPHL